jgi:hypothetical protein
MDVEKTMAFILDMQARAEVQSQKSQERMQQFEERMQKDREQSQARMQQSQAQMQKDREKAQESHNFFLKQHKLAMERMDKADHRHDKAMERMDKFDIQLKATANLVRAGMKMVIEDRKEFKAGMARLTAAQERTEATLKAFIASLKGRNGNGHR